MPVAPKQLETSNYISADDIVLPMPPCTLDQLDIQKQRDISSALTHSLKPVSHIFYQYPTKLL
jgi:hypothetical protein